MKRFIPYISTLLLFVSCVSDNVVFDESYRSPSLSPRYLHLETTNIPLDAAASTTEVFVEAMTTPWEFSGQASWLSLTPDKGTEDTDVTIAAMENMSGEDLRTSIFWLSSTAEDYEYQRQVTVTQRAATPHLSVSASSLVLAATGDSKSITVDKNIAYTISNSASWFSVEASEDSTKLTITAEPNPTAATRTARITLSGLLTQIIELTQEAAGMTSTEYGPLTVDCKGADYALQVTSEADWTASTNGSWFSLSAVEGMAGTTSLVLSVSPNNTTSGRNGKVDFKIGTASMFSISITQEGLKFTVSSTSLSMEAASCSRTLRVSSNTEWTVISKPAWITTSVASGSGDGAVTITASEHTGREVRKGKIEMGVEGVTGLVRSIAVSQSQHHFRVSPSSFEELPSTGGTHKVEITSDDNWNAEGKESWVTLSASSGKGDIEVTMTAADNPSIKSRSSKVLFTPTYASSVELTLQQVGRYLSVNTAQVIFFWRGGESSPIVVTTDGTYSVTTNSEWLKVEESGHSFTLTAEEHDAEEPRSAVVTVALTGLVDDEVYSIDIPVLQRSNIPVDIITFPEDQNWNIAGNTHASVTITGYSTDEAWDDWGDSSLGLNITVFGKDEDWNH